MKTARELFSELDKWKAYEPVNMPSSMVKVNHMNRLKREIADRIDVEKYKNYILYKEDK